MTTELLPDQAPWNPNTNITFELVDVQVWPEKAGFEHVVGRVHWIVQFERSGCASRGEVITLLDLPTDAGSFVNIDSVTQARAIAWALQKEGGERFLRHLETLHEPRLAQMEQEIGLVPWTLNA